MSRKFSLSHLSHGQTEACDRSDDRRQHTSGKNAKYINTIRIALSDGIEWGWSHRNARWKIVRQLVALDYYEQALAQVSDDAESLATVVAGAFLVGTEDVLARDDPGAPRKRPDRTKDLARY
jgi:hypothetical protein